MEGREKERTRPAPLTLILSCKIPRGVLVMKLAHLSTNIVGGEQGWSSPVSKRVWKLRQMEGKWLTRGHTGG